jgi:hypothetical protein
LDLQAVEFRLRSGDNLDTEHIDAILAHRDYFQTLLRDSIGTLAGRIAPQPGVIDDSALEAIFLLTEMGDPSFIPDLVMCLYRDSDWLDWCFGDALTMNVWLPFARVGHVHLDLLTEFLQDPLPDEFAKAAVLTGLTVIPEFHPNTRERVLGILRDVFTKPTTIGLEVLGGQLASCAAAGYTELEDIVELFVDRVKEGLDEVNAAGVVKDIRNGFARGKLSDSVLLRDRDVYALNKAWKSWMSNGENGDEVGDWIAIHLPLIEQLLIAKDEENPAPDALLRHYTLVRTLVNDGLTETLIEIIDERFDAFLGEWFHDLLFALADHKLVDEAISLGHMLADVHSPAQYLSYVALILADGGRVQETRELVARLRSEYPEDLWTRILCGQAFETIGDEGEAESIWRSVIADAVKGYDRAAAIERLVRLLTKQGRVAEVRAFEESEPHHEIESEQPPMLKVGRNDPCPCGSGKKFKKCHGE